MNERKKLSTITASGFVSLLLIFLSCASAMNTHDAWEGIRNNTLRVFVKLDIPDAAYQEHVRGAMSENLMNAGLDRAGIILMSYLRIHETDLERIESCRQKIEGLRNNGKMIYQKCSEFSCAAFIDFDISDFLDAVEKHEAAP